MTWFERLYENPDHLYKFVTEFSECYMPSFKQFASCVDEFQIFEDLGLKYRLNECTGDCMKCELDFLTNPKTYEFSINGEIVEDISHDF